MRSHVIYWRSHWLVAICACRVVANHSALGTLRRSVRLRNRRLGRNSTECLIPSCMPFAARESSVVRLFKAITRSCDNKAFSRGSGTSLFGAIEWGELPHFFSAFAVLTDERLSSAGHEKCVCSATAVWLLEVWLNKPGKYQLVSIAAVAFVV